MIDLRTSDQKHYNVLLCDDDDTYRSSQIRMIKLFTLTKEHFTFKTFECKTAEEALKILSKHSIDCVLLDYSMPGQDGMSAMHTMLAKYPDLCIIMVTGMGNEALAVEAMKTGAMDYLVKDGMTIELLERAIANAVTKGKLMRRIEEQSKALMRSERQRVMLQSLATACHHLAQPATVLRTYIVMLKRKEQSPEAQEMLIEAFKAIETISNVLRKLSRVSEYKTEKYLDDDSASENDSIGNQILTLPD